MKLYNVQYPFEVDMEHGSQSFLYPSIRAALADARKLFEVRDREKEDGEYGETTSDQKPDRIAVVTLDTVGKLTAAVVCDVINSEGGNWCAGSEPIGTITWDGKRARFEKGGVTQ